MPRPPPASSSPSPDPSPDPSHAGLSRRVFLTRAGGLVLTLGAAPLWGARRVAVGRDPYRGGGVWLAGDHHIHTCYSIDGLYPIAEQVESAVRHGLDFCVITDHGGPEHSRVLLSEAYPQLVAARRKFPQITVFQGLEWNIPAAEHGSIIVPPAPDEAALIRDFEQQYDARASTRPAAPRPAPVATVTPDASPASGAAAAGAVPDAGAPVVPDAGSGTRRRSANHLPPRTLDTEEAAVAGVRYLQSRAPKSLFFANHPARRGLDSPHELRAWSDAGPDVMRGFEGAPGHGAAPLLGIPRGHYGDVPSAPSHPAYPLHSYRTWGGFDYYVAQIGGLWDSLLGEGRAFYITANSDSHRFLGDRRQTDRSAFKAQGHVTLTGESKPHVRGDITDPDYDYPPGAYARTYVFASSREPLAILDGMRGGNMWTVLGGLVDGVELWVHDGRHAAPMGSTLLSTRGADVEVVLRVRPASRPNQAGVLPRLHHVDLISGQIQGPAPHRDTMVHPTAQLAAQWRASNGAGRAGWLEFRHRIPRVQGSFFLRVRGTNTAVQSPGMDALDVDPWRDLWFYTNPVMVLVAPA